MLSERLFAAGRLCVVGNICRDVKTAPLQPGPLLFRDGETPVRSIVETVGGGGANSAFTAAALGAKVTFVGKVGADSLGRKLKQTLRRHGIAAHLAKDKSCVTGTSIALAFESGHRHFLSCQPNNESLTFADLDLRALAACTHLLRADIWFSEAMLFGGNERLFKAARAAGLTVSIDLNWDPRWQQASAAEVRRRKRAVWAVLPWVNLAHGNVRELRELAEARTLKEALRRLEGWGVDSVVVHMGAKGAGYYRQGQLVVEPAHPTRRHVQTTGTGDVLSVCMMLLHEHPAELRAKLKLANRTVAAFIEGRRQFIPSI